MIRYYCSLPHFFVRPDLGPKMYSAYGECPPTPILCNCDTVLCTGSASTPDCSTTNLHLEFINKVINEMNRSKLQLDFFYVSLYVKALPRVLYAI